LITTPLTLIIVVAFPPIIRVFPAVIVVVGQTGTRG
jgi:hypothetical protein